MRQRGRGRIAETGDSGFDGGSAILCAPRGNWSNQSRCLCRGAGCLASIRDMTRYPRITRSLLLAFKHGFLRFGLVLINSGCRGLKCCKLCCRVSSARSRGIVFSFSAGCWSVEKHFICTCCYMQQDFAAKVVVDFIRCGNIQGLNKNVKVSVTKMKIKSILISPYKCHKCSIKRRSKV